MKSFQTILLGVFAFFIVGAVLIFSGVIGGGGAEERLIQEPVILWATIPAVTVENVLRSAADAGEKFAITYVEKDANSFENELVEALASDKGPDLIIAPHTTLLKQAERLLPLPESAISARLFRDSFVEAAEILSVPPADTEPGYSLALPLYLDPLVTYWNRDMFTKGGLVAAPATWLETQLLPEKLTVFDDRGNITEAAVGLGGARNVSHFKEILSAQVMQTGNPIASRAGVALASADGADSALRYFAEFGNPSLSKYSWNSAKRNTLDEFVAGKLAVYFGNASEHALIRDRNTHLNFDVANLPQIKDGKTRLTYADVYALAILKNSPVRDSAYAVATRLVFGESARKFSTELALPTARKELLKNPSTDPSLALFESAAVISKVWFDTSAVVTRNIFADMVESVMIGKASPAEAVTVADGRLRDILEK